MIEQPNVFIDDVEYASAWDGDGVVALADISLVWGRQDIFEETPPTQFTVVMLDPSGIWGTDNNLSGKPIVITRSEGRAVARGTISEIDVTRRSAQHPSTGKKIWVWAVTLTCRCVLAQLDQTYLFGPRPFLPATTFNNADPAFPLAGPWNRPEQEAGGWQHHHSDRRLSFLMLHGLGQYVDGVDVPETVMEALDIEPLTPFNWGGVFRPRARLELTALAHLQAVFRAYPLGHVNYDPESNRIVLGTSASSGGMSLIESSGAIQLSPIAGISIDSSTVILDEPPTVRSTVSSAIDVVTVPFAFGDLADNITHGLSSSALTARKLEGSTTDRELLIDPGFWSIQSLQNNPNARMGDAFSQALANKVRDLVDEINDKFSMPNVTFDLRRFEYDPELVEILLSSFDFPTPLHFASSIFAGIPNVAVQHQVIGGRLRWVGETVGGSLPAGWVLDATLAPATFAADIVAIDALVTAAEPTFEDFDSQITLVDLGNVTQGLD